MKYLKFNIIGVATCLFLLFSMVACVPSRQFDELKARNSDCQLQNKDLKATNQALETDNKEISSHLTDCDKKVRTLSVDTTNQGNALRRLNSLYGDLTSSYDKLLANNEKLLKGNQSETQKVVSELQSTQADLQKKEDALKKMEKDLNDKSKNLEELSKELKDREAKVSELQNILASKDSSVSALKNAVSDALIGFKGQGLTVEKKNGKVYVSLEERLLFASGSITVDKKGEEALKQLAKVMDKNKDINVMVEGHTDDVPMTGTCIKDNWDLSVMRATSVLKILTGNSSMDPSRITAAGRGEFLPLEAAKTTDARRKNRRTEIILTPKIDELLKVLESN